MTKQERKRRVVLKSKKGGSLTKPEKRELILLNKADEEMRGDFSLLTLKIHGARIGLYSDQTLSEAVREYNLKHEREIELV